MANEVPGLNIGDEAVVKSYPTIRYFPAQHDSRHSEALKAGKAGVEFKGGQSLESMVAWIEAQEAEQAHMGHHPGAEL